jgi:hypothetical protein
MLQSNKVDHPFFANYLCKVTNILGIIAKLATIFRNDSVQ